MKRPLFVAAAALAAACTAKAEGQQFEKKITERMKEQGLEVQKVTCPKSIEVKVDVAFTCQVVFTNQETFSAKGVVTSKSGSEFEYSLEFVEPNYIAAKLEKMIADGLTEQTRITPTSVTCGSPGIHAVPADRQLLCDVAAPDGTKVKAKFTFDAAGKAERWDIVQP